MGMSGSGQFSAKDLENAKLPPPPEESNSMDVLLRPGLLADVEIIVEKVPNAIYIPNQSLFEKDGKSIVYVKRGNKFEPQVVQQDLVIATGPAIETVEAVLHPRRQITCGATLADAYPAWRLRIYVELARLHFHTIVSGSCSLARSQVSQTI